MFAALKQTLHRSSFSGTANMCVLHQTFLQIFARTVLRARGPGGPLARPAPAWFSAFRRPSSELPGRLGTPCAAKEEFSRSVLVCSTYAARLTRLDEDKSKWGIRSHGLIRTANPYRSLSHLANCSYSTNGYIICFININTDRIRFGRAVPALGLHPIGGSNLGYRSNRAQRCPECESIESLESWVCEIQDVPLQVNVVLKRTRGKIQEQENGRSPVVLVLLRPSHATSQRGSPLPTTAK